MPVEMKFSNMQDVMRGMLGQASKARRIVAIGLKPSLKDMAHKSCRERSQYLKALVFLDFLPAWRRSAKAFQ
jgi:hypothetical protein